MTENRTDRPPDPPSWPITDDGIRDAFDAMLQDGSWGRYHGPHCDRLRDLLAEFHSVEHIILCSSGTSAVELALRAAQVQSGDEVILAAYDYKANFANVLTTGAVPVLIDTVPGLPVPDPDQLQAAVSDRTTAIICSHLHGCCAPIDQIVEFAKQRGLVVIEDACQSAGAVINGRAAGSIGDMGVLSFGGSKLLTAGRGGAVLTDDATLAQRIRLYTHRGNDAYPLSEMQAAVLVPQLKQLKERTQIRLEAVRHLLQLLPENSCLQPALQPDPRHVENSIPAYYKVAFRYHAEPGCNVSREEFATAMRTNGFAIDPAFPALHRIHGKSRFRAVGSLEQAARLHDELITLHHPILLSPHRELQRIADEVGRWQKTD